jgi:hypothetical protein
VKEMRDERRKWEKKKKEKKYADHVREKCETKFGEWILLIKIGEQFHSSKLFG